MAIAVVLHESGGGDTGYAIQCKPLEASLAPLREPEAINDSIY